MARHQNRYTAEQFAANREHKRNKPSTIKRLEKRAKERSNILQAGLDAGQKIEDLQKSIEMIKGDLKKSLPPEQQVLEARLKDYHQSIAQERQNIKTAAALQAKLDSFKQ